MRHLAIVLGAACLSACATPSASLAPVRIILIGDSTMAHGSGYGDALCSRLRAEATCVNAARGGRSTKSFREEGLWDRAMAMLAAPNDFRETYVLIQFGHNDQPGKPGRSTDLATEFPANMARYVADVRAAGGKPILVTPLVRRQFTDFRVRGDLAPWAEATRRVASEQNAPLLDLYADSAAAVQAMGPAGANLLAEAPPPPIVLETQESGNSVGAPPAPPNAGRSLPRFDYTHLGERGAGVFSDMVARELIAAVPELAPYFATPPR